MPTKPVIILSQELPKGLQANFAAVLAMSLGKLQPDLVGDATPTADGITLEGITTVAVPILAAPAEDLPQLFEDGADLPLRLAYMRSAFEARNYDDYTMRIAEKPLADHVPQALLFAGPRKAVDRRFGRLPLLR